MVGKTAPGWARAIGPPPKPLAGVAGLRLLVMMAVITLSGRTRYLLNNPLTGAAESVPRPGVA
ncbi:MAG: hypothetical protein K0M49_00260, partial [Arenimonas sp.]|nr:hypothetical protein [Arenimonas sp.]